MVDSVGISRPVKGSFVIEEVTLSKICKHLADATGESVRLAVKFSNDRTIRSEDMTAILQDSAISSFPIKSFSLTSGSRGEQRYGSVTFNSSWLKPVDYDIEGRRQFALSLEDTLLNELNSARNEWWFLNSSHWPHINMDAALSLFWGAVLAGFGLAIFGGDKIRSTLLSHVNVYLLLIPLVMYAVHLIGPIVAPKLVFNFGKGRSAYRKKLKVIKWVVGTVGVGIALNVGSSFIHV